MIRQVSAISLIALLVLTGCTGYTPTAPTVPQPTVLTPVTSAQVIKHVVVIFDENVSFDHYFGTYPNAANTGGTTFTAAAGTPIPDNYISNPNLLNANPNENSANLKTSANSIPANPFRLGPDQAGTGDQDHSYGPEQMAYDNGAMDLFPLSVGTADGTSLTNETGAPSIANTTALTMGYFDGNTVTALWNYAQNYALNDHSFGSTFGASTQGVINLVSGQTNGAVLGLPGAASGLIADGGTPTPGFTLIGDEDPAGDTCSSTSATVSMTGKNIGDLLNTAGVTWGNFAGGFNLGITNTNTTVNGVTVIGSGTGCLPNEATGSRATGAVNIPGNPLKADYIPHHEGFQYYASTQNLTHIRPVSTAVIGTKADTGPGTANHQYDVLDFSTVLAAGNLPAVSFIKPPGYQEGHAGYSDPLDEQTFIVNTVNAIEQSQFWSSTAIIIAYDDSDGWYDHVSDLVNGSQTAADAVGGFCNTAPTLAGVTSTTPVQGRCGYGPRVPFLVISPWAKKNFIDNTVTDQSSVIRFIEDTFLSGTRIGNGSFDSTAGSIDNMFNFTNNVAPNATPVLLNPTTGAVVPAVN
jgi:phospholipase C